MTIYNHPAKEKVEADFTASPPKGRARIRESYFILTSRLKLLRLHKHVYIKCDDVIISVLCY